MQGCSETGRQRWAASGEREDSSSGAALRAWSSSIPWGGVSPTTLASTSAPTRICLTGADRPVCSRRRRGRVSFGGRRWTQKGRGRPSPERLPCEKRSTEYSLGRSPANPKTRASCRPTCRRSTASSRLRLMPAGGAYGWAWDRSGDESAARLDSPLWPVAQSAAELLTSPKLGRVKLCAGKGCGWVFVDESRNGSRRWCDSRDCGNRERVRRHLARKRASGAPGS